MTRLSDNLRRRTVAWAGQLTRLAREFAPAHIRPAISSRVESKDTGTYLIRITADRKMAPDARAWEYGSGIHARRGPKKKYIIKPKTKKVLAFSWEVADQNPEAFRFTDDGRVMLPQVEHPGIQAANEGKGYIAPAQIELRKRAKRELGEDIRQAIMGDLRVSFGKKV